MRQMNRLIDDLRRSIEEAILSGEMRPGERLLVAQIAEDFNVSHTTVREAFLMLEQRGLVESRPRRGTFVTRISEREAYELCQTRALLESFAVSVAGVPFADEALQRLEAHIDAMRTCQIPHDLPRLIQADLAFHQIIIEHSGSSQLIELWSRLNGRVGALMLRSMEEQQLNINAVVSLHQQLLDGIRSKDITAAQRALVRHYVREQVEPTDNVEMIVHTLSVVVPTSPILATSPDGAG